MKSKLAPAIIIVLIISAAFIYVGVRSPDIDLLGMAPPKKILEFRNTRLIGRGNGKKQWEVLAEEIWSTKNQSLVTFEHVKDGLVYKNGRAVVKGLVARRVKYHKFTKKIEAFGVVPDEENKKRNLTALVDVRNISSREAERESRFIRVQADAITYKPDEEKAVAEGGVRVFEDDFSVNGDRMEIDGGTRKAVVTGNVTVSKEDTTITGRTLTANFENDSYALTDEVEILQKDKAAVGDRATMWGDTGSIKLEGNVKFLIEKGTAIVEKDATKKLRGEESKKIMEGKTVLTCDVLKLSTHGRDADASGNVLIEQQNRRARSDSAIYNGSSENITLFGNVFIEKGGEWLKTHKVIVSVSRESFEALGGIEAEFKIKK